MLGDFGKHALPENDKRWRIVGATIRRLGSDPHALIETLHTVQNTFGYVDEEAMFHVAAALRVPLSRVYGVVTFYHFFNLRPPGKHTCVVCTGTACYIKGAPVLLNAVQKRFQIKPEETTADGRLSLLTTRCVGACGQAPVAVVDGTVNTKVTHEQLVQHLEETTRHVD